MMQFNHRDKYTYTSEDVIRSSAKPCLLSCADKKQAILQSCPLWQTPLLAQRGQWADGPVNTQTDSQSWVVCLSGCLSVCWLAHLLTGLFVQVKVFANSAQLWVTQWPQLCMSLKRHLLKHQTTSCSSLRAAALSHWVSLSAAVRNWTSIRVSN